MGDRQRKPLYFGAGLDRISGALVVDPTSFQDLRNVHLSRGRVEYRTGHARQLILPAPWTDLLGVYLIRASGLAGAVAFNSVSKTVGLFMIDGSGVTLEYISDMWTMPTSTPPRITAADQYGTLVIAHDEANYLLRQQTMVYSSSDSSLGPLMLDLGRTGTPEAVKFRGVAKHLAYMLAWGYGTNQPGQGDRPEVLRISLPGEPTNFEPEHYFLVGTQGDPIIGGGVCGPGFAVQKIDASYLLTGAGRDTFGIGNLDLAHGIVSPRAGVSVNAEWFFWSTSGPRSSTGGASSDLGLPLDLKGTSPDALALVTSIENGFAYYDADRDEVIFVFGQWGYVLHMGDGDRRWSYRQFAVPLLNAGLLFTGGSLGSTIVAHPEFSTLGAIDPTYAVGDGDPRLFINWNIVGGAVTDELCEVWVQPQITGGAWSRVVSVAASLGPTLGATWKARGFWTDYRVAIRFVSGGIAGAGYTSSDPWTWPAVSRSTVQSTGNVVFTMGKWRRYDSTHQGFNAVDLFGPGLNDTPGQINIPYTYRIEFERRQTGYALGWNALASGITTRAAAMTAIRFANSDSLVNVAVRMRVDGPSASSPWFEQSERIVAPEPPATVGETSDTSDFTNDHDDTHDIFWTAPAAVNGEVPANGPYEARGRHFDNYPGPPAPNFGAYGATVSVIAGGVATVVTCPGFTSSGSTSRTAGLEVRVVLSGDVSPWKLHTTFEP
jgi:hypothetical protein